MGIVAAAGMQAGNSLDSSTHIQLGSALAVAAVVVPAVWWLSSWMRGITDKINTIGEKVDNLRCVREKKCEFDPPLKLRE